MVKDRDMEKLDTDDFFAQIYDELECLYNSFLKLQNEIDEVAPISFISEQIQR